MAQGGAGRKGHTPFRKSQARTVLEGVLRSMAPQMMGPDALRYVVYGLAADTKLWRELELICNPLPAIAEGSSATSPAPSSLMEPVP